MCVCESAHAVFCVHLVVFFMTVEYGVFVLYNI